MGPSAIRLAGIRERLERLGHRAAKYESPIQLLPQEYADAGDPRAKYLAPIKRAVSRKACAISASPQLRIVFAIDHFSRG